MENILVHLNWLYEGFAKLDFIHSCYVSLMLIIKDFPKVEDNILPIMGILVHKLGTCTDVNQK